MALQNATALPGIGLGLVLSPILFYELLRRHFCEYVAELEVRLVVFDIERVRNLVRTMGTVGVVLQERENVLSETVNLRLRNGSRNGSESRT